MMWIRLRGINLHRLTRAAFFEQPTIRPEQPSADATAFQRSSESDAPSLRWLKVIGGLPRRSLSSVSLPYLANATNSMMQQHPLPDCRREKGPKATQGRHKPRKHAR
jgi:hypothetical protein